MASVVRDLRDLVPLRSLNRAEAMRVAELQEVALRGIRKDHRHASGSYHYEIRPRKLRDHVDDTSVTAEYSPYAMSAAAATASPTPPGWSLLCRPVKRG